MTQQYYYLNLDKQLLYCAFWNDQQNMQQKDLTGQSEILAGVLDSKQYSWQGLGTLLGAYARDSFKPASAALGLILPLSGTITPRSDQIVNIAHHAGAGDVLQVEEISLHQVDQVPSFDPMRQQLATLQTNQWEHYPGLPLAKPQASQPYDPAHDQYAVQNEGAAWLQTQINEKLGRDPWSVEYMMFNQVNSEHCRHFIFKQPWQLDTQASGSEQTKAMMHWIADTTTPDHLKARVLSAYKDNAAVMRSHAQELWRPKSSAMHWTRQRTDLSRILKVETHNHPTGVSPFPGAATGVGGEIRDEMAVGVGGWSSAGLAGYMVSDLYEGKSAPSTHSGISTPMGENTHIGFANPRQIMTQAPLGASDYGNEFGRPNLTGLFRSFEQHKVSGVANESWGFDKPLMLAGGAGLLQTKHVEKRSVEAGDLAIVLGGPSFKIGIGGGAVSSVSAGATSIEADYASVQRGNAQMQRRACEVIRSCCDLEANDDKGAGNPIRFIHDVGAGGLSNALTELAEDCGLGLAVDLDKIPSSQAMDLTALWCNESQERFVMAVQEKDLARFTAIASREQATFAVVGRFSESDAQGEYWLTFSQSTDGVSQQILAHPLSVLFGFTPTSQIPKLLSGQDDSKPLDVPSDVPASDSAQRQALDQALPMAEGQDLSELENLISKVMRHPNVGSKDFLIHIADRSVGGKTARDQLVGPEQVAIADCAIINDDLFGYSGQAMAIGERPALALQSAKASVQFALAEMLTNLTASGMDGFSEIAISANWMGALHLPDQQQALYQAVRELSLCCQAMDIAVPVGKDSLSMSSSHWKRTAQWQPERTAAAAEVNSPMTVVLSASVPLQDVRNQLPANPQVADGYRMEDSLLYVLRPTVQQQANGQASGKVNHAGLNGSCIAELLSEYGIGQGSLADPSFWSSAKDFAQAMLDWHQTISQLHAENFIAAYHDISDGGMLTTAIEMALSERVGVQLKQTCSSHPVEWLFNERPGAIIQIHGEHRQQVEALFKLQNIDWEMVGHFSEPASTGQTQLTLQVAQQNLSLPLHSHQTKQPSLQNDWYANSDTVRVWRGDKEVISEQTQRTLAGSRLEPSPFLVDLQATAVHSQSPRVAIIREQGTNGQDEMAAAFSAAGFITVDVPMQDLLDGKAKMADFQGAAFCGGFSYGDALGAGKGWATSILSNSMLRDQFEAFFHHEQTFSLGVCNGCQLLSHLKELIPGAQHWPSFMPNASGRYEARLVQVQIEATNDSFWLNKLRGSRLLVPISHGEGRAFWSQDHAGYDYQVGFRYAGNNPVSQSISQAIGQSISQEQLAFPMNPNGSMQNIASVTAADGRILAGMPHPERVYRTSQLSWAPKYWKTNAQGEYKDYSPWLQLFHNAFEFSQNN